MPKRIQLRRTKGWRKPFAAEGMRKSHMCIDTAMTPNGAVVVEFNPLQLGNLGLYACDVRALATASRRL
ncbi:MAG: hypothetical protein RLW87_20695 [Alphaproteobacteria bacterium]